MGATLDPTGASDHVHIASAMQGMAASLFMLRCQFAIGDATGCGPAVVVSRVDL